MESRYLQIFLPPIVVVEIHFWADLNTIQMCDLDRVRKCLDLDVPGHFLEQW